MDKLKIDKLIVVEGKYDKIRLENIVDGDIFAVNGFSLYNDSKGKQTLKNLASKKGVLILTDSDAAGYKIRVYLNSILNDCDVINVFAPEIKGKEARKIRPSASGLLGIEGTDDLLLRKVLSQYTTVIARRNEITYTDLYTLGFLGSDGAKKRKNALLRHIGVQQNVSNNFLLRILNDRYTRDEFYTLKIHDKIRGV